MISFKRYLTEAFSFNQKLEMKASKFVNSYTDKEDGYKYNVHGKILLKQI